jgi:hypothetical protein
MAGDYLFPKRLFKNGEPLDTTEINEALQPPAERMNGHIGPHNIRAPIPATVLAEADTFTRSKSVQVLVDPGLINAISGSQDGQSPDPEAPGAFVLEQETGWQVIDAGEEPMLVTIDTGVSDLVLTAYLAYCYAGNVENEDAVYYVDVPLFTDPELRSGTAASDEDLDFAIVLDGTVFSFVDMSVPDRRQFSDYVSQSRDVAQKIVDGALSASTIPASKAEEVQQKGWLAASGYSVRRKGRRLYFTGPKGTGLFRFSLSYNGPLGVGGNYVADMTLAYDPSGTPATPQRLSDLPSATYSTGVVAAPYKALLFYAAQVQYAFRVDGVVLTETITGRFDNEQPSFTPARIVAPRNPSTTSTGPYLERFRERPDAINIPMYSVRMSAAVSVEPGQHLVELVTRRVPCGRNGRFSLRPPNVGDPSSSVEYTPTRNRVVVYNRQLLVTESPIEPFDAAAFGVAVTVPAFDSEDVVSQDSLVNDRLTPVAEAENSVESYQVARGAVNGDHLEGYSTVLAAAQSDTVVTSNFDSVSDAYVWPDLGVLAFPDRRILAFTDNQFYAIYRQTYGSLTNWKSIVYASHDLVEAQQCVITVEGNVFLRRLIHTNKNQAQMHLAAAVFCIGLQIDTGGGGGAPYLCAPSVVWVNSNNYMAHQAGKTDSATPSSTDLTLRYLSQFGADGVNTVVSGDEPADYVDVPVTAQYVLTGNRRLIQGIRGAHIFGSAAWMGDKANGPAEFIVDKASVNIVITKS